MYAKIRPMVIERDAPRGMVPSDHSNSKLENTGTFTYMEGLKQNKSGTRFLGLTLFVVFVVVVAVLVWNLVK